MPYGAFANIANDPKLQMQEIRRRQAENMRTRADAELSKQADNFKEFSVAEGVEITGIETAKDPALVSLYDEPPPAPTTKGARIPIQRNANDSPFVAGAKNIARTAVGVGEFIPEHAKKAASNAFKYTPPGLLYRGASYLFSPPSTDPVTADSLNERVNENTRFAPGPSSTQNPPALAEAQGDPGGQRAKASEEAVKKLPSASEKQKEGAANLLKEKGKMTSQDIDDAAKKTGADVDGLTEKEKAWLIIEFGLRMMAEGGQPGATVGGAMGAAGFGAIQSMKDVEAKKEKKAEKTDALKTEQERYDEERAFREDQAKWDRMGQPIQTQTGFYTQTPEGFTPAMDPASGKQLMPPLKEGTSQWEMEKVVSERVTEILSSDFTYLGSKDPEFRAKKEADARAAVLRNLPTAARSGAFGGFGGGQVKAFDSPEAVKKAIEAGTLKSGDQFTDPSGEIYRVN